MAFNVGDSVVVRDGFSGQVVSKYYGTLPSEAERILGFWEASNFSQIPQWYLSPSISLDSERNAGKTLPAFSTWTNFHGVTADWSGGREFMAPYTEYGVGRLELEYNYKGDVSLFANNGAGGTTVTVGANHGRIDGDSVLIYDTVNYDGFFTIFNTTSTTFDIARVFVSTEPGKWAILTSEGRGVMEEVAEETITGFQIQRAPIPTATGLSTKLNHPFIP